VRIAYRLSAALGAAALVVTGLMIAFAPATAADTGPQSLDICAPGSACVAIPLLPASTAPDIAALINTQLVFQCGGKSPGSIEAIPFVGSIIFCESGINGNGNDAYPLQFVDSAGIIFALGSTNYSGAGGNSTAGLFTAGGDLFLCTQEAAQPC
jgi:hypothetical protein